MIEIHPRRPPAPTEKNLHSSSGREQDKQRSIVILQLVHDPENPYIRASDIAASAWQKKSKEYDSQAASLRGGIIRCHLSGQPDNKDENGNILKSKSGCDQKEAWTVASIQGALTLEAHNIASAEINKVCDRYEDHLAAGRQNVHFYYSETDDIILERDLDIEAPLQFPDSHYATENLSMPTETNLIPIEAEPPKKHQTRNPWAFIATLRARVPNKLLFTFFFVTCAVLFWLDPLGQDLTTNRREWFPYE